VVNLIVLGDFNIDKRVDNPGVLEGSQSGLSTSIGSTMAARRAGM
jgi:hypothetical protein